ncbi:conserved protein of unknown function [Methanocaldococcus lauensis]|uniref:HEPN domain-containing protein n=1 Tax=Methanocaldococcus lauensis TaxID=2546128 RepID=A0A8D6PPA9_9EURY|nr:hypothetical protein [Methanocaldococcus lauensis]CAB3287344.1 conserved protein of unknown function [Methanocaldococcus lauensis]
MNKKFNVDEFKEIAEKLPNFETLPKEGKYRTAIGRYYYSIFLTLREIIWDIDKREELEKYYTSGLVHKIIRIYLYKLSKIIKSQELMEISNMLYNLHNLRKLSDYNIIHKITIKEVNDAKEYANKIQYLLNIVEFQNVKGFENILRHLKKIGEREGDKYKYFPKI